MQCHSEGDLRPILQDHKLVCRVDISTKTVKIHLIYQYIYYVDVDVEVDVDVDVDVCIIN